METTPGTIWFTISCSSWDVSLFFCVILISCIVCYTSKFPLLPLIITNWALLLLLWLELILASDQNFLFILGPYELELSCHLYQTINTDRERERVHVCVCVCVCVCIYIYKNSMDSIKHNSNIYFCSGHITVNSSYSVFRRCNIHTQHGFLYLACIHTRYIVSSLPRLTCRRRSTRFCTSSNPAPSNRLLTSSETFKYNTWLLNDISYNTVYWGVKVLLP